MKFLPATAALAVFVTGVRAEKLEEYPPGPDSDHHDNVPHGLVLQQSYNARSGKSIYPGTVRDYWVYVPKQYTPDKPAALMVFQDGGGYVSTSGPWRAPWVLDNLIAKGEIPVMIGLFVNPGEVPSADGTNALPRYNRSYEYDTLNDEYARFLIDELIPEVSSKYRIADDPESHGIAGASSGGICAFNAAWRRPDYFRRVFSAVGSFVGLRGGEMFPTLLRETEPKPLRIFLQDGYRDQNIYGGNWWLANQEMLSALQFSGYDVTNKWGAGGHDARHGGMLLPDALRWLWRGYPGEPIAKGVQSQAPAAQLVAGDWELVGKGYQLPAGMTVNERGEVFFADRDADRVYRIGVDGTVAIHQENTSGALGLAIAPDGALLASQPGFKRLVVLGGGGDERFVATDFPAKSIVAAHSGAVYAADSPGRAVRLWTAKGGAAVLDAGIDFPSGVCLSPDQSLLYVSDMAGQYIWSFQIGDGGGLRFKQKYFRLMLGDDPRGSGADGLCVDTDGRLYAASALGVQVFDQAGRVNVVLTKPEPDAWATAVCFGGADFDRLYLAAGDKVWRRRLNAHGAPGWRAPTVPKPPRL
jgi:gluconolactonase